MKYLKMGILFAVLGALVYAMACQNPNKLQNEKNLSMEEIIKEAEAWMEIKGVEGVGQGQKDGKDCIHVLISCEPVQLKGKVPDVFKGVPVYLTPTGTIKAD